ncbi:M14 family zinc carboxypeptidase [Nocardioides bruguierae]|uniref:Succinylglutamate desuccinylase/aspartoacylase family protein n=1 Tax=Nocardioides bruguierae TaxID=2945102 RepID=A0A9X2D7E2_9ACTN|nr:M14 family zinc carboxypeptidase [Nocardioides bruguierae]MCM0620551.1 succinylglutamate desuccinylase/aspartoacylase family protein [Nocardioides bruguierae]
MPTPTTRTAVLVSLLLTATLLALPAPATADTTRTGQVLAAALAREDQPAVVARRKLGESVEGRPIMAYRLGEPARRGVPSVVLIATMHGDERRTRWLLQTLRDGDPVVGIDLWVVPTFNPDGLAADTRANANGVDLNRNWPYRWRDLDGRYESGSGPASEPETQAVMAFLKKVQPQRILSFHQPLKGVDTDTKDRAFARRVAKKLHLPEKTFDCGGTCYGTMTSWYNHHFDGSALTVEYGRTPTRKRLVKRAPRQVLRIFGAAYGGLEWGADEAA